IYLEYACFKIGVICAPLDLRLKAPEVIRSLNLIKPKGFAFLGKTPVADFSELGKAVMENCPYIEHFIQFVPPGEEIKGAVSAFTIAAEARKLGEEAQTAPKSSTYLKALKDAMAQINENDGALVIYTTGSTGLPKPALLSHRNITSQNMCLGGGFGMGENTRMLVNLPPSHVGCQTEQLMTTFFWNGTNIILHIFDAEKSLKAIQDYKATVLGQIPALFAMEWRLPNYDEYDLSSLEFAIYGGQQVSLEFLKKLSTMAPRFGTGLGLTETAGFVTYTPPDATLEDIAASIGYDMPITPMTIRKPMNPDGTAGEELPDGEIGEVCFSGPQIFIAYVNNEEAYKATVSKEGICYTGDLGRKTDKGLQLVGRSKLVIKPKGYQVYPAQVEDHFCALKDKVASCAVVGVEHEVFSEGIVAFIEKKPGADISIDELERHAKGIASYMRPLHYVILEPGKMPLNRVAKTDYMLLKKIAKEEVEKLRAQGLWDK
ncbi:MAG TPA: long-chain fatty acid--CoA ligase, partial [Proteobacteria bacterium]|nr:long-chain fatty acid--CoA ligase [Pseudomonadota bacterium]